MGGGRLPIAESGIEDLYHKVFRYELAQIVLNIGEHLAGVEVLIGREILIEALVGHLIVGIDHMYAYGEAGLRGGGILPLAFLNDSRPPGPRGNSHAGFCL